MVIMLLCVRILKSNISSPNKYLYPFLIIILRGGGVQKLIIELRTTDATTEHYYPIHYLYPSVLLF